MWKHLQSDKDDYLVKHTKLNSDNHVCITNLIHLWQENIPDENIIQRCREMNPLLEAEDSTFIEHIFNLIDDKQTTKIIQFNSDNTLASLEMNSNLEGIKFSFLFKLHSTNADTMFRDVTAGAFIKLQSLIKCQKQLVDIIRAKDLEIEQYKLEGAVLARKLVETQKFNESAFTQNVSSSWPSNINDSYEEIFDNYSGIKKIIEKNLGIVLDINEHQVKSDPSTPEKHAIKSNMKHSRKRTYVKNISPGKLKYDNQDSPQGNSDLPSTSVKLEESTRKALRKRKIIKRILR